MRQGEGLLNCAYWCAQVLAYVSRVKDVTSDVDNSTFTQEQVEANDVRCPDAEAAKAMYKGGPALPGMTTSIQCIINLTVASHALLAALGESIS